MGPMSKFTPTCERCGQSLREKPSVALELNAHTGRYSEPGTVPTHESQGVFFFGADCARKIIGNAGQNQQIRKRAR
jgi:hypothetical protein